MILKSFPNLNADVKDYISSSQIFSLLERSHRSFRILKPQFELSEFKFQHIQETCFVRVACKMFVEDKLSDSEYTETSGGLSSSNPKK